MYTILSSIVIDGSFPQLAKSLGNKKPAILVKVERLLWECILQVATGQERCYKALGDFFSKVDCDEMAMVSEADCAHFADGWWFSFSFRCKMILAVYLPDKSLPEIPVHILSTEGETGVSASWTLAHLRTSASAVSGRSTQLLYFSFLLIYNEPCRSTTQIIWKTSRECTHCRSLRSTNGSRRNSSQGC